MPDVDGARRDLVSWRWRQTRDALAADTGINIPMGKSMSLRHVATIVVWVALASACVAENPPPAAPALDIVADVPDTVDPAARYLFYLHGAIIERAGERPTHPVFGVYEYRKILETFADRGLIVISEARPAGTEAAEYAAKVAQQVRTLLAAGVPPDHVTVAGFSKGGGIAILASSSLARTYSSRSGRWPEPSERGGAPGDPLQAARRPGGLCHSSIAA